MTTTAGTAVLPRPRAALAAPPAPGDGEWLARAVPAVERCVTRLVDDVVRYPARHRTEASLHARLVTLLLQEPVLGRLHPLADGRTSQLVQGSWPEAVAAPGALHRGEVDVAVLTPGLLAQATSGDLLAGRVVAPVVLQVRLDRSPTHLREVEAALSAGRVLHPYLVHLGVAPRRGTVVEAYLTSPLSRASSVRPVRVALAHREPDGVSARVKHLDDLAARRVRAA